MTITETPSMQYVRLGKTGLRVSRLCMGLMGSGDPKWSGWAQGEEDSLDLIKKAYDAGINFFDTADVYSSGESERILGKAIRQFNLPRDRIVVATKLFFPVLNATDPPSLSEEDRMANAAIVNRFGLSRKHIFDAVDASLKRLGLDYIDLYQIHRFDKNTPVEETMGALHDLVKAGKVRYIGASSMYAWQFQKMNHVAEKNGWTQFVSMQNLYNLLYREEEREVYPYCLDAGIGAIPWSPLAGGQLTAKNRQSMRSKSDMMLNDYSRGFGDKERDDSIVDRVAELAEKKNATLAQIALAWMLTKPYISAPIVGINKPKYLYDLVGALNVKLTEEEIKYLEENYVPKNVIPM